MIWAGSFKSLQSALHKPSFAIPPEVHTWLRSETDLISPFVDWLMSLIAGSGCVPGKEAFVELTLREALSNAMIHGNRMDHRKLVHVLCCCEGTKGVFIVVRDQGHRPVEYVPPRTVSQSVMKFPSSFPYLLSIWTNCMSSVELFPAANQRFIAQGRRDAAGSP